MISERRSHETVCICCDHVYLFAISYTQGDSSYVIVISLGEGVRSKLWPLYLSALSSHYNIVAFEFTSSQASWCNVTCHPFKTFFDRSYLDVITVAHFVREYFKDKQVIGLGICYGAFILAQAQALSKKRLFDKLIFDSCFLSVASCVESFIKDPMLCCDSIRGGCPQFLKCILSSRIIYKPIVTGIACCMPEISVLPYLSDLKESPVLFIRGQQDPMVLPEHFDAMWEAVTSPKAVYLTPFHHSNNFREAGRAHYLYSMKRFLQNDFF